MIEKHITLRRSDGGADGAFSMEPEEFEILVREGKAAAESLGDSKWSVQESEKESRRLRRSLYIAIDVKAGEKVTEENTRAIRPGFGCLPKYLDELIGKRFKSDHAAGTPMNLDLVD